MSMIYLVSSRKSTDDGSLIFQGNSCFFGEEKCAMAYVQNCVEKVLATQTNHFKELVASYGVNYVKFAVPLWDLLAIDFTICPIDVSYLAHTNGFEPGECTGMYAVSWFESTGKLIDDVKVRLFGNLEYAKEFIDTEIKKNHARANSICTYVADGASLCVKFCSEFCEEAKYLYRVDNLPSKSTRSIRPYLPDELNEILPTITKIAPSAKYVVKFPLGGRSNGSAIPLCPRLLDGKCPTGNNGKPCSDRDGDKVLCPFASPTGTASSNLQGGEETVSDETTFSTRSKAPKGIRLSPAPWADEILLTYIPAGKATIGTKANAQELNDDKKFLYPKRKIEIPNGFLMGIFPVTRAQWNAVMGENPNALYNSNLSYASYPTSGASSHAGDSLPMTRISPKDAEEFCDKLTRLCEGYLPQGYRFKLPTEIQWEYACRANTRKMFSFGSTCNGTQANCDGRHPYCFHKTAKATLPKPGPYLGHLTNVGSYNPNDWGLYDMHGNCCEWTYRDTQIDEGENPYDQNRDPWILRGGCYGFPPKYCRSSSRYDDSCSLDYRMEAGFRVILTKDNN